MSVEAAQPDIDIPGRIEIREASKIDRREIEQLWSRRLGSDPSSALDLALDDESAVHACVATNIEEIVGFGICLILQPAELEDLYSVSFDGYPLGDRIAVMHMAAVDEGWENRGIGSALMQVRLSLACEYYDVDSAFGLSWLRENHLDSSVLFEKFGFERVDTVEGYFGGGDGRSDCPDCGAHCECSAGLYFWTDERQNVSDAG